jgi:hypothetical protein
MKMEQIEYSEMSAYKIQTPGNYPEENIQHTYTLFWSYNRPVAAPYKNNRFYSKIYFVLNNHYNFPFHKSSSEEGMRKTKLVYKEPELN